MHPSGTWQHNLCWLAPLNNKRCDAARCGIGAVMLQPCRTVQALCAHGTDIVMTTIPPLT